MSASTAPRFVTAAGTRAGSRSTLIRPREPGATARWSMPRGIVVRAVEPGAVTGLTRFYGGLAFESRRARFLGLVQGLYSGELVSFCRPDRLTRDGFAAVTCGPSADQPEIAGHLCLEPGGPMMIEAGVAVADAWRAQGIGTALAVHGLLWARAHRVHLPAAVDLRPQAGRLPVARPARASVSPVADRGGGRRAARRRPSDGSTEDPATELPLRPVPPGRTLTGGRGEPAGAIR